MMSDGSKVIGPTPKLVAMDHLPNESSENTPRTWRDDA